MRLGALAPHAARPTRCASPIVCATPLTRARAGLAAFLLLPSAILAGQLCYPDNGHYQDESCNYDGCNGYEYWGCGGHLQCAYGYTDSACTGVADGTSLGDGSWCWGGERHQNCPEAGTQACDADNNHNQDDSCDYEGCRTTTGYWGCGGSYTCVRGEAHDDCNGQSNGYSLSDGSWCWTIGGVAQRHFNCIPYHWWTSTTSASNTQCIVPPSGAFLNEWSIGATDSNWGNAQTLPFDSYTCASEWMYWDYTFDDDSMDDCHGPGIGGCQACNDMSTPWCEAIDASGTHGGWCYCTTEAPTPAPTPKPTPAPTPKPTPAPNASNALPMGLIIGIAAGGALVLLLICVLLGFVVGKMKSADQPAPRSVPMAHAMAASATVEEVAMAKGVVIELQQPEAPAANKEPAVRKAYNLDDAVSATAASDSNSGSYFGMLGGGAPEPPKVANEPPAAQAPPAAAPKFDPMTGKPLAPPPKFDPMTGKPIPKFDPMTGKQNWG